MCKELQDGELSGIGVLGLYDFGARYYDPVLGRWFNVDPALQMANPYLYCGNNPMMYVDPDGRFWFFAAIFAIGNAIAHAIRGDISDIGDVGRYFSQGFVAGAAIATVWQLGGPVLQTAMTSYAAVQTSLGVAGMIGGVFTDGWDGLGRGAQAFLGNFYVDENSWEGGVWQGLTRHTWEMPQSMLGHGYTQARNAVGRVDRVDYLGGATFATRYASKGNGVSMGSYVNINYAEGKRWSHKTFDTFVASNPLYMHEYGHTIDSRRWGPMYLLSIGVPSLISSATSREMPGMPGVKKHRFRNYEISANRRAKKYFGDNYGVDWSKYAIDHPLIKR